MSVYKWSVKSKVTICYLEECCAICRHPMNEFCLECFANKSKDERDLGKVNTLNYCKSVLWTLLLCRTRKESPIHNLDLNLVMMIFNWATLAVDCPEPSCQLVMVCLNGHTYHEHCWDRWIKKRNCCPLDNEKPLDQIIDFQRSCKVKCEMVSVVKKMN